jgi:hypothetical protein
MLLPEPPDPFKGNIASHNVFLEHALVMRARCPDPICHT